MFESCHEELVNDACENYDNAAEYFEKLYENRINFAHCFRSGLTLRGNQTNNFVESQFLVLKDVVLKRTKEFNIVALVGRLTTDLESYYKEKLLSVADGSFDGSFRMRFMGKGKAKKDGGLGYKVPTEDEKASFSGKVKKFSKDISQVASFTDSDKW